MNYTQAIEAMKPYIEGEEYKVRTVFFNTRVIYRVGKILPGIAIVEYRVSLVPGIREECSFFDGESGLAELVQQAIEAIKKEKNIPPKPPTGEEILAHADQLAEYKVEDIP